MPVLVQAQLLVDLLLGLPPVDARHSAHSDDHAGDGLDGIGHDGGIDIGAGVAGEHDGAAGGQATEFQCFFHFKYSFVCGAPVSSRKLSGFYNRLHTGA